MRKVLLLIGFNLLFLNANAQTDDKSSDWHQIEKTLNLYIIKKAKYMERFNTAPHAKSSNWSGRIVFIDVTNTAAVAKVEISTSKLLFTDYFNLMKTKDGWFLVDKISTRTPHKTVEVPATKSK